MPGTVTHTSLRLPLSTGSGTLDAFVLIGVLGLPAMAVMLVGAALLVMRHWVWGGLLIAVGAFFGLVSWELVREGWNERPCDYVLANGELRIHGGCADGLQVRIADIDTDGSGVRQMRDSYWHDALELALRDGPRRVLVRGHALDEMIAFLDVVRAAAGQPPRTQKGWLLAADDRRRGEKRGNKKGPGKAKGAHREAVEEDAVEEDTAAGPGHAALAIVTCPGCGAPQVPAATATVACPHCGAACEMPEAVRRRLAAAGEGRALDARAMRALRRVLAQPSSRQSFIVCTLVSALGGGAWLLSVVMFVRAMWTHTLDAKLGWHAAWFPVPVGVLAVLLAWRWQAGRKAVKAVMLDFGALAPAAPGEPYGCHGCGAPLATVAGAVVADCGYCGAANVLGADLPRDLRSPRRSLGALKKALRERAREMAAVNQCCLWGVPVALLLVFVSGRWVVEPDRVDRFVMTCDPVMRCFMNAMDEERSAEERVDWLRASCRLDDGEACLKLGAWQYQGELGLSADPAAAMPLLVRACELAAVDACEIVEGLRAQAK